MKWLFIILTLIKLTSAFPQKHYSYQLTADYGTILGTNAPKSNISGISFDINRQTSGGNYWQADHNYPQMGLHVNARNLNDYTSLSYAISLIPYLEFNVLRKSVGTLQIKHGTGLAWFFGKLDAEKMQPIGSRLNAASLIDVGFHFTSLKNLEIKPGIVLMHQSNGNILTPNNGLNTAAVYFQGRYYPNGKLKERTTVKTETDFKRWRPEVRFTTGFYGYDRELKTIKTNQQLLLSVGYQHNTQFRTHIGGELLFTPLANRPFTSVYLEENVLFGHLITKYGFGYYVNYSPVLPGKTYGKVGIAWFPFKLDKQIGRVFSIGTAIKAHGFQAANIDVSAGYLF